MAECTIHKRNQIPPEEIQKSVDRQCARHESMRQDRLKDAARLWEEYKANPRRFSREPDTAECINSIYDSFIELERTYYSTVKVVKLGKSKYILAYGEDLSTGTGPSKTAKRSREWFMKDGR